MAKDNDLKVVSVEGQINTLQAVTEERFSSMDDKLDSIDDRFHSMDKKLDVLFDKIDRMQSQMHEHAKDFRTFEEREGHNRADIDTLKDEIKEVDKRGQATEKKMYTGVITIGLMFVGGVFTVFWDIIKSKLFSQ